MSKELISATVTISKIFGEVQDYKNLPIIRNDIPIGTVTSCVDGGNAYVLTLALWQEMNLQLLKGKPISITFDNI